MFSYALVTQLNAYLYKSTKYILFDKLLFYLHIHTFCTFFFHLDIILWQ